jgi:hypothetical protein
MNTLALNLNLQHRSARKEIKNKNNKKAVAGMLLFWGMAGSLFAQAPAATPQPDPLMQLMLTQPPIEITSNIVVTATFDPPVITPEGKSTYRVTINAVSDSVRWPEDVLAPTELTLRLSARGQHLQPTGATIRPMTTINHHVTATKTGTFTIPEFKMRVYGKPVTVPAAQLQVVSHLPPGTPPAQRLFLQLAATNAYCGQPIKVQVFMPFASNVVQALSLVQMNGDGVLLDQGAARQRIRNFEFQGRTGMVFMYESTVTPLVAGRLDLSVQAFTSGNQFSGNVVIQGNAVIPGGPPQYVLLDSDPVPLEVEPLPRVGVLPGFTGAIGQFTAQPVKLSAAVVRVGEMVKVIATFETAGEAKRLLAPPPPAVTNWQIFPPLAENPPIYTPDGEGGFSTQVTFSYTMMPLTNNMTMTPAIPFSYFDPEQKKYVDLTIPAVPITVRAGAVTDEAQSIAQAAAASDGPKQLKLSELATTPGTVGMLLPLQQNRSFLLLQLLPLCALTGLWYWDKCRKFREQHPALVRRRAARRALRRVRRNVRAAALANDEARFAASAVEALRVACAPHFPATPNALVGRDILEVFDEPTRASRAGEMVRALFADLDAFQFGRVPTKSGALLAWQPELDELLDVLEGKL